MSFTSPDLLMKKVRYLITVITAVTGFIFLILLCHIIGIIIYYSDYFALLFPDPPLPIMRRPKEDMVDKRIPRLLTEEDPHTNATPRILCLIATSPQYHDIRASHVDATWAQHCTKAVFLTSEEDPRLSHTVLTPNAASYWQLWDKIKLGFEWAYEHREEYDWFYKTDDDTFAVIENLQAALAGLDPNHPQATGYLLSLSDTPAYFSGGAGYVLSNGALIKLVEKGLRTNTCDTNLDLGTNEDVNMGSCLTYLGVEVLDSRDSLGRQRFNAYSPKEVVDPRQANRITHLWLKTRSVFHFKFGYSEMSNEVISFHYVNAEMMYLLYYLIYFVNPINSKRLQTHQPLQKLYQQTKVMESNLNS